MKYFANAIFQTNAATNAPVSDKKNEIMLHDTVT